MYLKRRLREDLFIFKSLRFPYVKKTSFKGFRYNATIGIGGNIGDVKRRFEHLFVALQKERSLDIKATSLILQNPPFGYTKQDDFFNSIMVVSTNMTPQRFLQYLLHLEKKFARKRSFANAPRTLDLDIIFFDNRTISTQNLKVPHPCWAERESVVIPLASMHR